MHRAFLNVLGRRSTVRGSSGPGAGMLRRLVSFVVPVLGLFAAGCGNPDPAANRTEEVGTRFRDPAQVAQLLQDQPKAAPETLAELRGGFVFSAGSLIVRFGLETSTTINGDLVASSSITGAGDLSSQTLIEVAEPGVVVTQSTLRNVTGALTIIRNVVPDTVIEHITRITVDVANFSPERNVLLNLHRDIAPR